MEPLIPGLPHDIALLCIARVPFSCRSAIRAVNTTWRQALSSSALSFVREKEGLIESVLITCSTTEGCDETRTELSFRLFDAKALAWCHLTRASLQIPTSNCAQNCFGQATLDAGKHQYLHALSTGKRIIVLGGFPANPIVHILDFPFIWEFDAASFKWQHHFDQPQLPTSISANFWKSHLYSSCHEDKEKLMSATQIRQCLDSRPPTPPSFCRHGFVQSDGKLYVFSSCVLHRTLDSGRVDVYDSVSDSWTTTSGLRVPAFKIGRGQVAAVHGQMFGVLCTSWKYSLGSVILARLNLRDRQWEQVAEVPVPRELGWAPVIHECHLTSCGDRLMVVTNGGLAQRVGFAGSSLREMALLHIFNPAGPGKGCWELANSPVPERVADCMILRV